MLPSTLSVLHHRVDADGGKSLSPSSAALPLGHTEPGVSTQSAAWGRHQHQKTRHEGGQQQQQQQAQRDLLALPAPPAATPEDEEAAAAISPYLRLKTILLQGLHIDLTVAE